jgi:hypothetical protein
MQRADHSSKGVIPTVVRRVWSINLVNQEALAHWGLSRQKQTNKQTRVSAPPHQIYSSACQIRGLEGRHANTAVTWCQNTKCSEFRKFCNQIHSSFATRSTSSILSVLLHINTWHVYFLLHSYSLLASHFAMNNLSTSERHFASPLAAPLLQETISDEKEISLQLHQIRTKWIRRWILIESS